MGKGSKPGRNLGVENTEDGRGGDKNANVTNAIP